MNFTAGFFIIFSGNSNDCPNIFHFCHITLKLIEGYKLLLIAEFYSKQKNQGLNGCNVRYIIWDQLSNQKFYYKKLIPRISIFVLIWHKKNQDVSK